MLNIGSKQARGLHVADINKILQMESFMT